MRQIHTMTYCIMAFYWLPYGIAQLVRQATENLMFQVFHFFSNKSWAQSQDDDLKKVADLLEYTAHWPAMVCWKHVIQLATCDARPYYNQ